MVLKTTLCRFSGLRIYPGKGVLFIRTDSSQYLFLNKKCRSLFFDRKRPAKLAWTFAYRKAHKKDQVSLVYACMGLSAPFRGMVPDLRRTELHGVRIALGGDVAAASHATTGDSSGEGCTLS